VHTSDGGRAGHRRFLRWFRFCVAYLLAWSPLAAEASIFKGEALDKAADVLAIVILIFVPIAVIALFWMVHVLPEKIAEKRHHPQQTAIKTLCLLSLVFGGLLWPIAWLWAYTKPIGYKLAYGTDKHEDYFKEALELATQSKLTPVEREALEHELDALAASNQLTPELRAIRERLHALHVHAATPAPVESPVSQPATLAAGQPSGQPDQPGGAL
jgi:hypothetical protein